MRVTKERVELCAGREGDDEYVSFDLGEAVTKEHLHRGRSVLEYFAYAVELAMENVYSRMSKWEDGD
jgi:hypothetical protein